jgi:hypothetical protein
MNGYGYGYWVVCGNYEGNLEAIVEVLNGWEWYGCPYPEAVYFVVHDGRITPNYDDEGARFPASEDEDEDIGLAELSTIAPLLTRGTIEFVWAYGESITTLTVHSDGRAQQTIQTYDSEARHKWYTCSTETFPTGVVSSEDMKKLAGNDLRRA